MDSDVRRTQLALARYTRDTREIHEQIHTQIHARYTRDTREMREISNKEITQLALASFVGMFQLFNHSCMPNVVFRSVPWRTPEQAWP